MASLLVAKRRHCPVKLVDKKGHHNQNPSSVSTPLSNFHSKISFLVNQTLSKPEYPPMSLKRLTTDCFDLMNITNNAFLKLAIELDYPVHEWGVKATEEYLSYTLNMLNLLNSVHSSISRLNHNKISMFHALTKNSPSLYVEKIPSVINLGKELTFEQGICGIGVLKPPCSEKEKMILQALSSVKKIGLLALGFVITGLCSNGRMYDEIRRSVPGLEDSPLVKSLDSRFHKEIVQNHGICEEVRDVNCGVERLSGANNVKLDKAVVELRIKLDVLGDSIKGIEKEGDKLFSEVLAVRSKLLNKFRSF